MSIEIIPHDPDERWLANWYDASKALPPFGALRLCRFRMPDGQIAVGICRLVGNEFMSEWLFPSGKGGFISVGVIDWTDPPAMPPVRRPA